MSLAATALIVVLIFAAALLVLGAVEHYIKVPVPYVSFSWKNFAWDVLHASEIIAGLVKPKPFIEIGIEWRQLNLVRPFWRAILYAGFDGSGTKEEPATGTLYWLKDQIVGFINWLAGEIKGFLEEHKIASISADLAQGIAIALIALVPVAGLLAWKVMS